MAPENTPLPGIKADLVRRASSVPGADIATRLKTAARNAVGAAIRQTTPPDTATFAALPEGEEPPVLTMGVDPITQLLALKNLSEEAFVMPLWNYLTSHEELDDSVCVDSVRHSFTMEFVQQYEAAGGNPLLAQYFIQTTQSLRTIILLCIDEEAFSFAQTALSDSSLPVLTNSINQALVRREQDKIDHEWWEKIHLMIDAFRRNDFATTAPELFSIVSPLSPEEQSELFAFLERGTPLGEDESASPQVAEALYQLDAEQSFFFTRRKSEQKAGRIVGFWGERGMPGVRKHFESLRSQLEARLLKMIQLTTRYGQIGLESGTEDTEI